MYTRCIESKSIEKDTTTAPDQSEDALNKIENWIELNNLWKQSIEIKATEHKRKWKTVENFGCHTGFMHVLQ